MVHEQSSGGHHHQQLPRYGSDSGPGVPTGVARASKKNKPKKIPQRGLGVAQLEKLRIEEQKKMEGAAVPGPAHGPHPHAIGGGGGLGHLLSMHRPPPPPLSLSALPRPAADGGVHCGFPPVLWDPADPMRHPYKRSMCPQPPLPTVRAFFSSTDARRPCIHADKLQVSDLSGMEAFRWAGEHGLVADGVVEPPPNGAPFKPNVQQQR